MTTMLDVSGLLRPRLGQELIGRQVRFLRQRLGRLFSVHGFAQPAEIRCKSPHMSLVGTFRTCRGGLTTSALEGRTDIPFSNPATSEFDPERTFAELLATSIQAIFFVRGAMLVSAVSEAGSGPDCTIPSSLTKSSDRGSMARRSKSACNSGRSPSPQSAAIEWNLRMVRSCVLEHGRSF
jgi:hypothetical protein